MFTMKMAALLLILCVSVANAQDGPKLPDGVIHVKLPPGEVRIENLELGGKPILRVTVGKTVVEARTFFIGDGKGATQFNATKEGIHWATPNGGQGTNLGVSMISEPGSAINEESYIPLDKIKSGSLFVTTPSIIFRWGNEAKRKSKLIAN